MSAEHFVDMLADVARKDQLPEYRHANAEIQWGVQYAQLTPPPNNYYSVYGPSNPTLVAQRLDPGRVATQAAMWTNAISTRGHNSSLQETVSGGLNRPISDIWKGTRLGDLAEKVEVSLNELKPQLSNQITKIDVEQMQEERLKKIRDGSNELLVFTGLNGAGKDWAIGKLKGFLDYCGIPHNVTKMPNPDGVLFPIIDKFLHGKIKLERNAAQMLFLADALDTKLSNTSLGILNRHPSVEALVYGEKNLQPTVLSSQPLFDSLFHVFVVNRHPAVSLDAVTQRDTSQRVFELKFDAMLDQQNRLAALTFLPGYRWLDTDFDAPDYKSQVIFSVNRLLCMVQSCGIVQRTMVKLGMAENYAHANVIYENKYWDFKQNFGFNF